MTLIISSLLSFCASWLPELFKLFQRKQDNAHELRMVELQRDIATQERLHRTEVAELDFAAREVEALHKDHPYAAIEILKAIQSAEWMRWYTAPLILPALYLFVVMDWINAAIRPGIAIAVVGLYAALKWQVWDVSGVVPFSEDDYLLLFTVVGFFFGGRQIAKRGKYCAPLSS